MPFTGSCHCGLIAYEVAEDAPTEAMECNCSICRRRGALHHFTTPDKFDLKTSRDALTTYKWNKQNLALHFCKHCGCAPFASGARRSISRSSADRQRSTAAGTSAPVEKSQ